MASGVEVRDNAFEHLKDVALWSGCGDGLIEVRYLVLRPETPIRSRRRQIEVLPMLAGTGVLELVSPSVHGYFVQMLLPGVFGHFRRARDQGFKSLLGGWETDLVLFIHIQRGDDVLHRHTGGLDLGPACLAHQAWSRDRHQNAQDGNHEHEFKEGKSPSRAGPRMAPSDAKLRDSRAR